MKTRKSTRAGKRFLGLAMAMVIGVAPPVFAEMLMASGKIVAIDAQQQRVKLKTGIFSTKEFAVAPHAQILAGQQFLALDQVHRGVRATVQYRQEHGQRIVDTMTITQQDLDHSSMRPPGTEPSAPATPMGERPLEGVQNPSTPTPGA